MAVTFESYSRRIDKITKCLKEYGISSLEEAKQICTDKGIDVDAIVKGIQPIAFENAVWAYTVGCAIAIKKGCKKAADAAEAIGIGLQSFCKRPSALHSWQVTNLLPQQKARSVLQ